MYFHMYENFRENKKDIETYKMIQKQLYKPLILNVLKFYFLF